MQQKEKYLPSPYGNSLIFKETEEYYGLLNALESLRLRILKQK